MDNLDLASDRISGHVHMTDSPDSLEIGTPGKGGAVKIYGDFNNPEGFQAKIANAMKVREYAQGLLGP